MIRRLLIGLTLSGSLMACGSGADAASQLAAQKAADTAAIDQLEVNYHRFTVAKDIDNILSLWAVDAVFVVGHQTYIGKQQIRQFYADQAAPFRPENHWISDTPAYKIHITVSGDTGTLYFECHYIDIATHKVMSLIAADTRVARIDGHWVFTRVVSGTAALS